jgi:tetratricopeptide (TPR) repeat protein
MYPSVQFGMPENQGASLSVQFFIKFIITSMVNLMSRKKTTKKSNRKRVKIPPKRLFEKKDLAGLVISIAITIVLFADCLQFDFVNWDDDVNILANPNLKNFDWASIKGIFTSNVIGNYNPLTIFTFAVERHFFGFEPMIYHLDNLLLHIICVFFCYFIFKQLGLNWQAATLGALLFGIHPMRIESVAWITERKDVLFGAFYLASGFQYLKYINSGFRRKHLIFALILAIFSCLAKIQAVALPLSFLAFDYLLKRPLKWKLIVEKLPFFALSLFTGITGIYFLSQHGSLESSAAFNLGERLLIGSYTYMIYIVKFIFPFQISALYPYPVSLPIMSYLSPVFIIVLAGGLFWMFKRNIRQPVFGFLFFTLNVMFVLQIVGAGQAYLADRFTYIPYFGFIFLAAYYWDLLRRKFRAGMYWVYLPAAAYLFFLIYQSGTHVGHWRNSDTLWSHVLTHYDKTPLPYRNRANYFRDQKMYNKALEDYSNSIRLKKDPDVVNSRARLYFDLKDYTRAIEDYNLAISLNNQNGEYWVNRGSAFALLGNTQNALRDLNQGLLLDPQNANGYKSRSIILQQLNQHQKALDDIATFLQLSPYEADVWYESGRLKRFLKREQDSIIDFTRAIQLNGNKGLFYYERSKAYLATGNRSAAQQDLSQAASMGIKIPPEIATLYQ